MLATTILMAALAAPVHAQVAEAPVPTQTVVPETTQQATVGADGIRRSALLWHFTVLGEAASQVPSGTKDANPKIAWRAATRLRNRIVHGYWDIDVETLVATAIDDLPQMIAQLEDALSTLLAAEDHDPHAQAGQPRGRRVVLAHRPDRGA